MLILFPELIQVFNAEIDVVERNVYMSRGGNYENDIDLDPLRGLPAGQYQDEETAKLQRYFTKMFHSFCWDAANEYELIPSK